MLESMHDWTLLGITTDWGSGRVVAEFKDGSSVTRALLGHGFRDLRIPRENKWGPSVSVNCVSETPAAIAGTKVLKIEMQSGDVIEIVAEAFQWQFS